MPCGYLFPNCDKDQRAVEDVPITQLRASLHYLHAGKGKKVLSTHTVPYAKWDSITYYIDDHLQIHIDGQVA